MQSCSAHDADCYPPPSLPEFRSLIGTPGTEPVSCLLGSVLWRSTGYKLVWCSELGNTFSKSERFRVINKIL